MCIKNALDDGKRHNKYSSEDHRYEENVEMNDQYTGKKLVNWNLCDPVI